MIVLDTHALVFWMASDKALGRQARQQISGASAIGVPTIVCWEVASLAAAGRLRLDRDVLEWIRRVLAEPRVELLAITPEVAVRASKFGPLFSQDPADRLIAATAIELDAPLITRDERMQQLTTLRTIW